MAEREDPEAIFTSMMGSFGGRLDVKLTDGADGEPQLEAGGERFAMLHDGELAVRLHPIRCAELVEAGKGRLLVRDGHTHEDWLVVEGLDAAEWTGHAMEALGATKD